MRLAVNSSGASFEKLILNIGEYRNSRINTKEVYVKGNLYDVKSVSIIGDKVELLVINDMEEKILLQQIKDFLQRSNPSKKELPDKLQKLMSINYIGVDEDRLIYIPSFDFNVSYRPDQDVSSDPSDIPSPPPKFC